MSDTTKKGKSDKMKRTRKDNATLKSHPNSKKICTLKDTYQSKIQVIKHGDTNTSSPTNQDTDHPLSAPNADHTDSTPSQAPNTMPHFIIYDFGFFEKIQVTVDEKQKLRMFHLIRKEMMMKSMIVMMKILNTFLHHPKPLLKLI